MRAIWKGAVSFGLVNVPVKLYGATESHDLEFHQVHDEDGGRIRYERRCEVCGEKVEYKHIDKAFEEDGDTVVITDAARLVIHCVRIKPTPPAPACTSTASPCPRTSFTNRAGRPPSARSRRPGRSRSRLRPGRLRPRPVA